MTLDGMLYEMGIKEKEHEVYFLGQIKNSKLLPIFERIFSWGARSSLNDVDLENKYSVENAGKYCKTYKSESLNSRLATADQGVLTPGINLWRRSFCATAAICGRILFEGKSHQVAQDVQGLGAHGIRLFGEGIDDALLTDWLIEYSAFTTAGQGIFSPRAS